jgi:adenylate kinase family enzyme
MRVVYLIGQPGAGKSTLMREATSRMDRVADPDAPFAMDLLLSNGVIRGIELGRRRDSFSGTDALGMAVMPKATAWVRQPHRHVPVVAGEGDRLASTKFFDACLKQGLRLRVVLLQCPDWLASERRERRGSSQSPTWVKGRITKTDNLGQYVTDVIDGADDLVDQTAAMRELLWGDE